MQRFFAQFTMDFQQLSYEELNQYNANFNDLFESFESDISFQFTNQSPPFIHIENPGIQMISNFRNEGRSPKKVGFRDVYQDQKSELYSRLRNHEIKNTILNKNEPYIKITVIKNQNQFNPSYQMEHYINKFGLIGSIKNADTEDVIIGRQEKLENNQGQLIFPNDINMIDKFIIIYQNQNIFNLVESERLISRIHCKIIYKNFFKEETSILPLYQKTLGDIKLPFNIIQRISSFLEEPKDCYVQDIGSVFGTHIKISRIYSTIKKYQQYSIGSETIIQILEIHNLGSEQKSRDQEFDKLITKLRNVKYKCSLQGLDLKLYQKTLQVDQSFDEILTNLKCYKIPFIVIKFGGSGVTDHNQNIFFAKDFHTVFSIGRGNGNNIRINSNTISRKQTRFRFNLKENNWEIADGIQDKESANGTWMQLQTIQERDQKLESQIYPFNNFQEIKLSEFILKIELFNGNEKEKTRLEIMNSLL